MTTNSQLSTNEPKKIKERKTMKTKTKQITKTKSDKSTSHGGISVGMGRGGIGGEGSSKEKHNW